MASELDIEPLSVKDRKAMAQFNTKRGRASKKDSAPVKTYRYKSKDGSYRYVTL